MKLLYYIPSFGEPNLKVKVSILQHNIKYIYNQNKEPIDICINLYTSSPETIRNLECNKYINKLFVYEKKGVLTELFLTNPNNSIVKDYDYIFFIFDDIKIRNINIMKMIEIKKKYNFELLSPKILKATHRFMSLYDNGISINNFLEIYFLLSEPKDFYKFISLHTIENKWMWGVDFLFGYNNIKVGIYFDSVVEHMISSNSNKKEAFTLCNNFIKKKTEFNDINDLKKKYKSIKQYCKD